MKGPLGGHFVWPAADAGPIALIGGGSGVVPLASMIRHRAASGSKAPVSLIYSSREWDEVIFRDELLALDDQRDGFDLTLTLTRDKPRRDKDFGRRIDPDDDMPACCRGCLRGRRWPMSAAPMLSSPPPPMR